MGILEAAAGDAAALATGGPSGWALKHWKLIAGSLAFVALGIMLMIAKGDAQHWHKVADRNHDLLIEEQGRHAVTSESLRVARLAIDDNNRRIAEAAKRLEADRRQAAADDARAAERWHGTQATIATLAADARRTDRKPCTLSNEARRALEDL